MHFDELSLMELRDEAKKLGVKNIIKYRKAQLKELLEELTPPDVSLEPAAAKPEKARQRAVASKAVEQKTGDPKADELKDVEATTVESKMVELKAAEPKEVVPKEVVPSERESMKAERVVLKPKAVLSKRKITTKAAPSAETVMQIVSEAVSEAVSEVNSRKPELWKDVSEQEQSQEQAPKRKGRPPVSRDNNQQRQWKSGPSADNAKDNAKDNKKEVKEIKKEEDIEENTGLQDERLPMTVITEALDEAQNESKRQVFNSREQRQNYMEQLDSGEVGEGILEIMPEGYGFLRTANYLQGPKDIYISPSQIRRFNLRPGDSVRGSLRSAKDNDKFNAILFVKAVNGDSPDSVYRRPNFEDLRPVFPDEKLHLEVSQEEAATRLIDLIAPIGKGQRGMIVSPPKAGKTVLIKKIANAITVNHPDVHLIVLLIDERPEEVTDIQRSIKNKNADIVFSTFDETPEHHKKVTEIVMERAQRLVEQGKDCVILCDSITRMARAYNLTIPPGGRTLSGGLDPSALYMPKKFFGAARNIEGGGSLTILATALVDTGSRLDDMVFEEFKGTGNMELVLDRRLSEKRIFPAIDINKSGTRREDLLLTPGELEAVYALRRAMSNASTAELAEEITDMLLKTKNNREFIDGLRGLDKRYVNVKG